MHSKSCTLRKVLRDSLSATFLKMADFQDLGKGRLRKRKSSTSATMSRKKAMKMTSNITVFQLISLLL